MRSKSILVLVTVAFCIAATEANAAVVFDDGLTHNIEYEIDDLVEVWDSSGGGATTVNLVAGGSITGDGLYAHDHSQINVSGGFIDGGSIKYNLKAYDNSQIEISGGSIGNYLYATDNSEVTLSGGFIATNLEAHLDSNVIITGGSIGFGGEGHGWDLMAYNNSEVTISSGMIAYDLHAFDNTQVTISGGSIGHDLYAKNSSQVSISGGVLGRLIVAGGAPERHNSVITIDGSGFNYPFGVIADSSGTLTGTLISGDPINNDFLIYDGASIVLVPEPTTTPPVADADGPYVINVGDTLTLDANSSTDDDNDIVSYMWDLDDNNSFETDASNQALFDVNYTYLQSLGLLINYTYTIHLKVTDSEGQSDVNDSTLIIVPKPALAVAVDIKPGSCPNPVNVKSSGVLPIAILGTEDVNVTTIDPTSIRLAGVEPIRSGYEDVAGPVSDSNDCNCITDGADGFLDLTLKFKTQRIVETIGDVNDGDVLTLELTGVLFGERPIEGADCILIRGRHKPINPADINKDGVVNAADFAIIAENWLQSTIVQD